MAIQGISSPPFGLNNTSPLMQCLGCDDKMDLSPRNFGSGTPSNTRDTYLYVISAATMKSTRPRELWIHDALIQLLLTYLYTPVDLPLVRDSASHRSSLIQSSWPPPLIVVSAQHISTSPLGCDDEPTRLRVQANTSYFYIPSRLRRRTKPVSEIEVSFSRFKEPISATTSQNPVCQHYFPL